MAQNARLERALDEAIDLVLIQEETVQSVLARYPDMAGELEPLIRDALRVVAPVQAWQPSDAKR